MLCCIVAPCVAASAPREPRPDHTHQQVRMLSAFSDDVKSVMLWNAQALRDDAFPLHESIDMVFMEDGDVFGPRRFEMLVNIAIGEAGLNAVAHAGSDFIPPSGIGAAEFVMRWVCITERDTGSVREALEEMADDDDSVHRRNVGGTTIYSTTVHMQSPATREPFEYTVHIGVVDDHTVFSTWREDEVPIMIERLTTDEPTLPQRWADAAGDLDIKRSPIVVLREYDPHTEDHYSPAHPRVYEKVGIDPPRSLAMALDDIETINLRLSVRGEGMEGLADVLRDAPDHVFLTRSPHYAIKGQADDHGFHGVMRYTQDIETVNEDVLFSLYGTVLFAFGLSMHL